MSRAPHSDAGPELLKRLHQTPVAEAVARFEYFGELLDRPVEQAIAEFLERGLLRHASLAERLDAGLTALRLRELLRVRGARADGGKAALVSVLLQVAEAEALEGLAAPPWLVLTEAGRYEVARYVEALHARRDTTRARVRACVLDGDVDTAATIAAAFHSTGLFPPGINVDCTRPVLEPEADRLAAAGRVDAAVAVLMCDPLPEADLEAYKAVLGERSLEEMRRAHAAGVRLAVRILPGRQPCPICGDVAHRFTWADLEAGRVPRLPLHPGCTCSYCSEVLD